MGIPLTPQIEDLINRKVESGLYDSPSDVVGCALKLLDERDRVREQQAAELNRRIQIGLDQLDRGEIVSGKEFREELRRRREERGKQG